MLIAQKSAPTLPDKYVPPRREDYSGWNEYTPADGDELYTLLTGGTVVGSGPNDQITRPAVVKLDTNVTYHYSNASHGYWLTDDTHTGTGDQDWLYIISDQVANLPTEGTRVDDSYIAGSTPAMAHVTNNCKVYTFEIDKNVQKVRFIGVEFSCEQSAEGDSVSGVIICGRIYSGDPLASDSEHCQDIIFDQCYVHGTTADYEKGQGFGIVFSGGTRVAVIDSLIDHIRGPLPGGQPYALYLSNCCNGITLWNNKVSCKGWPIFFGGNTPPYQKNIRDVWIVDNHLTVDTVYDPGHANWHGGSNEGVGIAEVIEIKFCDRCLIEQNYFDYDCGGIELAGHNYTWIIKAANQNDESPWISTENLTIRWNDFRGKSWSIAHKAADIPTGSDPGTFKTQDWQWVLIENNLIVASGGNTDVGGDGSQPRSLFSGCNPNDTNTPMPRKIFVRRNTFVGILEDDQWSTHFCLWSSTENNDGGDNYQDFEISDCVMDAGYYGILMDTHYGNTGWERAVLNRTWSGNVVYGPKVGSLSWPAGTTTETSIDDVGFTQWADRSGSFKITGTHASKGVDYDELQRRLTIAKNGIRLALD